MRGFAAFFIILLQASHLQRGRSGRDGDAMKGVADERYRGNKAQLAYVANSMGQISSFGYWCLLGKRTLTPFVGFFFFNTKTT